MYEEKSDPISRYASAAFTQDRVGLVINSSNQLALPTAGGPIDGILIYAVSAIGDEPTIYTEGNILARSGGTCTAGGEAMVTAAGKFVDIVGNATAVGRF